MALSVTQTICALLSGQWLVWARHIWVGKRKKGNPASLLPCADWGLVGALGLCCWAWPHQCQHTQWLWELALQEEWVRKALSCYCQLPCHLSWSRISCHAWSFSFYLIDPFERDKRSETWWSAGSGMPLGPPFPPRGLPKASCYQLGIRCVGAIQLPWLVPITVSPRVNPFRSRATHTWEVTLAGQQWRGGMCNHSNLDYSKRDGMFYQILGWYVLKGVPIRAQSSRLCCNVQITRYSAQVKSDFKNKN